jgi:hypothetical protein
MIARLRPMQAGEVTFAIAGDSGAWPDATADGIYRELLDQVSRADPLPAFFVNLGDFAGPGTVERHEHYLRLVKSLPVPNLCVIGNHDLDDPSGWDAYERIHGPVNFTFGLNHTRFVALHAEPGVIGEVDVVSSTGGLQGPRDQDLAFLDGALRNADEPHRVVLMHMPPHLGGHYGPHADWGFEQREGEFLSLLREHRVSLVCCAHGLAFDTVVHNGIRFVMSGGGGTGLCSHYRGICTAGHGRPEDRGSLFHVVEITIAHNGDVAGRVIQAFDDPARSRIRFGPTGASR